MNTQFFLTLATITIIGLHSTACVKAHHSRGYVFNQEHVEALTPGTSTRDDVLALLGSPTSISQYEQERWHYIGREFSQKSVLEPELETQQILTISFNEDGTVADLGQKDKKDAKAIESVSRTTPTAGHELGIMEQLLGNFGRFNSGHRNVPGSGGPGGPGGPGGF